MSVRDDTPPEPAAHSAPAPTGAQAHPTGEPRRGAAPQTDHVPGRVLLHAAGAAAGFGGRTVIARIDLEVRAGETVAIVGRSGGGKTTLLHLLAGLVAPSAGRVQAEPAALMPQRDGLLPWASARDNAALGLRVAGIPRREARHLADGQLAALGLADAAGQRVAELSGGMRQRVALARTLLTGRKLLLLDEPLAAVDALTRAELHRLLLAHLATGGRGAVLVTHDLDEAVLLADRVLVLGGAAADPSGFPDPSAHHASPGVPAPTTLLPGPPLTGRPGERLEHRGGDAVRATLLDGLGS